jgi:hypothetical protein
MTGNVRHRKGGASNGAGDDGKDPRYASTEWKASTIRMTAARKLCSARLDPDIFAQPQL